MLKKNQTPGHFGTVAFGAGSRQEAKSFTVNKYVTSASYNYKNKWLALGTSLNYNNKPVFAYGDLNRTTQTSDSTQLKMLQYNSSERKIAVTSARVTADITLSPTNSIVCIR